MEFGQTATESRRPRPECEKVQQQQHSKTDKQQEEKDILRPAGVLFSVHRNGRVPLLDPGRERALGVRPEGCTVQLREILVKRQGASRSSIPKRKSLL